MPATAAKDCSKRYHHGNLHDALILAAAELIEESGSSDFAMIEAARRAGVSSAAPYRHFGDKDALLVAVAELGFMGLGEAVRTALAEYEEGTPESAVALGKAYIRYLLEHKPFYDLMWGEHGAHAMKEKEELELKGTGFDTLRDCVIAVCEKRGVELDVPEEMATRLWAIAHGLANLAMNGQIDKFLPEADVYDLLESSTLIFIEGISAGA